MFPSYHPNLILANCPNFGGQSKIQGIKVKQGIKLSRKYTGYKRKLLRYSPSILIF